VNNVPATEIARRERVADERDRVADERDRVADERDRVAAADDIIDAQNDEASAVAADERERVADERDRVADARDVQAAADDISDAQDDEASAVAAHSILNSAAVVSMGIDTLDTHWQGMRRDDRVRLLHRMQTHALSMDDRLRDLIQGRARLVPASRAS
jgi:hypothetical protein